MVKQNEGFINVYSERNRGTTFKIYLPSYDKGYRESFQTAVAQKRENQGETILLVEDNSSLLDMTQNMLERIGYHILAANSPNEAIEIAKKHSGCIDLLLTDIVMPEMNGLEMSKQIQTLLPDINVLFTSGYTTDVIARNGLLLEGVEFIEKPYSIDQLAQKLQCILSGEAI
jgi:CheY-like chemotaxis protein